MAETFFNKYKKHNKAESAALVDDHSIIFPFTVRAMKEIGIDISHQKPKRTTQEMVSKSDVLVLVSPDLKKELDKFNTERKDIRVWDIPDVFASDKDEHLYSEFVKARNIIENKVKELLREIE